MAESILTLKPTILISSLSCLQFYTLHLMIPESSKLRCPVVRVYKQRYLGLLSKTKKCMRLPKTYVEKENKGALVQSLKVHRHCSDWQRTGLQMGYGRGAVKDTERSGQVGRGKECFRKVGISSTVFPRI